MNAASKFLGILCLAAVAGCGEGEEAAKRAIEVKHRAFLDALVADDLDGLMAIYAGDAEIRMIPFSDHEGTAAIREFWKVSLDDGDFEGVVFEDVGAKIVEVVRQDGVERARISGTLFVRQANGGTYEIQYNDTFVNFGGEWKIVRMAWRFRT